MQDKFGKIYEASLNIAMTRDGRKILYSVSNVKNIDAGLLKTTVSDTETGAPQSSMFGGSIPHSKPVVNIDTLC